MTEEMLKKIKQLPPLPESAMQIERVYQDPNSSFNDMVKILEKDPLLTADILKSANSPLYGFSREITSISQAVGLFGMGTVRGFALASIVKKSFALDLSIYGIDADAFALLSKKQHALVTSWCLKINTKILGILSPAAFLVEIGKALIAQQVISDKNEQKFKDMLAQTNSVDNTEKAIAGVDTPEVSASIFEHWKFEQGLVDTIRYCNNPNDAPSEVTQLAKILHVVREAVLLNGTITDDSMKKAKDLVIQYGLDIDSFEKALQNAL